MPKQSTTKPTHKPFFRMFQVKGKQAIKRFFNIPRTYHLSDEEYVERVQFIMHVMNWESFETKCYVRDFITFHKFYKPNWVVLWNEHKANPERIRTEHPLFPNDTEEAYKERQRQVLVILEEYERKLEQTQQQYELRIQQSKENQPKDTTQQEQQLQFIPLDI